MNLLAPCLGLINIFLVSNLVFRKVNFSYLLITLFLISSPVPIFAYTNASYIKIYFNLSFAISIIFSLFKHRKNITKFKINYLKNNFSQHLQSKRNILIFLFSLSISFLLLLKIYPYNFRFEAHDLLYYSWLNDLNNIDYIGPLRLPTAYPNHQSANHLMAGSLLTPFLIFGNNINMFISYSVKYFLVVSTFVNFIFKYLKISLNISNKIFSKKNLYSVAGIIFIMIFYMAELDYSLSISNYPLILVILTVGTTFFDLEKKNVEKNKVKQNSYIIAIFLLVIAGLVSKATTFPVISLSLIFLFLTTKKKYIKRFFLNIKSKYYFIASIIFIFNFLSWVLPESNHGSLQLSFPFCLADWRSSFKINDCYASVFNNPFSGWYVSGFKTNIIKLMYIKRPLFEFVYIWLICLFPLLIIGIYIFRSSKNTVKHFFGKFLISFVLSTTLSIVFLRDSISISGAHTAHSYIIAPCLTIITSTIIFNEKVALKKNIEFFKSKYLLFLVIFSIFAINFDHTTTSRRESAVENNTLKEIKRISLTLDEIHSFDKDVCTKNKELIDKYSFYLDSNGCGGNDIGELKAAIEGERTNISLFSDSSIIKDWALESKNQQ